MSENSKVDHYRQIAIDDAKKVAGLIMSGDPCMRAGWVKEQGDDCCLLREQNMLKVFQDACGIYNPFLMAATMCCDESLSFVISRGWFSNEDIILWLEKCDSINVGRLKIVLPKIIVFLTTTWGERYSPSGGGPEHLAFIYGHWATNGRCDLLKVLLDHCVECVGYSAFEICNMQNLMTLDDWCECCFEMIFGTHGMQIYNLEWTKYLPQSSCHRILDIFSRNPTTRPSSDRVIGPRLMGVLESCIKICGPHFIPLDLTQMSHPQIVPLLNKYCPNIGGMFIKQLFQRRGKGKPKEIGEQAMNVLKLCNAKERFNWIRCEIGLKGTNELLDIGGLDVMDVTHAEVIDHYMECPQLVQLMSSGDLRAPPNPPNDHYGCILFHILKKSQHLETHIRNVYSMYPNISTPYPT
jgi:hypothetical protein